MLNPHVCTGALISAIGTCTPYKGTFCDGVLNPGDYVYVGLKTIAFSYMNPSLQSNLTYQGNLTFLTTFLEQYWNFSGLLDSAQSPTCKRILRNALCTYYYPVCRNASGNVTVLHTICPSNCDYIAQSLCPTEWAMFYRLSLTAPSGLNLNFNCQAGASKTVQVVNPYCCISVALCKSIKGALRACHTIHPHPPFPLHIQYLRLQLQRSSNQ